MVSFYPLILRVLRAQLWSVRCDRHCFRPDTRMLCLLFDCFLFFCRDAKVDNTKVDVDESEWD
jgi:hypothetical protein